MALALKVFKSAGVPVTAGVHRAIVAGNQARDRGAWADAALAYRRALSLDPDLAHIWVQLGHAEKESGAHDRAEAAYMQALALKPKDADVHLHLGHLKKLLNHRDGAVEHYLRAAQLDPANADAGRELNQLALVGTRISYVDLMRALRPDRLAEAEGPPLQALGQKPAASVEPAPEVEGDDVPALVFDVSDLISYFRLNRLPTGIQRVQIEVISAILEDARTRTVKLCCFVEQREDWLPISRGAFLHLCELSLQSGERDDPAWVKAIDLLQVSLNMASHLVFPRGAFLINLGTSWWLQNYFLHVRKAKALAQIRYVPFIHDMIPILAPEHCTKGLTQDFISWVIGAFQHADFYLANSQSTRRDLIEVAKVLGHDIPAERVAVIPLNADFRKAPRTPLPRTVLETWRLDRSPYVLFVSTVESRKNHQLAFDAWTALLRTHGPRRTPKLVCVGKNGWLNDAVYRRLDLNEALRNKVVMLSDLSDQELELLYRECLFTLYPSNYEGWGLPVTESLCFGKPTLIADSSSLPEAGGAFADYFPAGSLNELTAALGRLIFDGDYRRKRETNIAGHFKPQSWRDIAKQIEAALAVWSKSETPEIGPENLFAISTGVYHPIRRNFETTIWPGMRSAEIFRSGSGWWHPDGWGCWTKASGGTLIFCPPAGHGRLRVYLRLHGLPERTSRCSVNSDRGDLHLEGELQPGEFKWLALDLPADPGGSDETRLVRIRIQGDQVQDLAPITGGQDVRVVSVGVQAFYVCEATDALARANFIEAVILDNFDGFTYGARNVAAPEPETDDREDVAPGEDDASVPQPDMVARFAALDPA